MIDIQDPLIVMDNQTSDHQIGQRLRDVERGWHELSSEMAGVKSEMHTVGQAVSRIEASLINKQPAWNNATVLGLIFAVGGFMYALNSYIGLELGPIDDRLGEVKERQSHFFEFERQVGYEFGVLSNQVGTMQDMAEHQDELRHKLEDRVRALESRADESQVTHSYVDKWLHSLKTRMDRWDQGR